MAGLLSIAFIVGWFLAACWLARLMTRKFKNGALRTVLMILAVIVAMILPVADEIIDGFQFRALCKENAVLKIDAKKIKDRTVRMVSDPANKSIDNAAIKIYYTRVSYRDVTTQEELARNGYMVAMGGRLIEALSGGHETTPITIFPSTCSGPGNFPTSQKYEFKFATKTVGVMQ